jgi:hypothetical protein
MASRLPSLAQLQNMGIDNASDTLGVWERDAREYYPDDRGVTYGRGGRAYGRKLQREKLKRITKAREALGLPPYLG